MLKTSLFKALLTAVFVVQLTSSVVIRKNRQSSDDEFLDKLLSEIKTTTVPTKLLKPISTSNRGETNTRRQSAPLPAQSNYGDLDFDNEQSSILASKSLDSSPVAHPRNEDFKPIYNPEQEAEIQQQKNLKNLAPAPYNPSPFPQSNPQQLPPVGHPSSFRPRANPNYTPILPQTQIINSEFPATKFKQNPFFQTDSFPNFGSSNQQSYSRQYSNSNSGYRRPSSIISGASDNPTAQFINTLGQSTLPINTDVFSSRLMPKSVFPSINAEKLLHDFANRDEDIFDNISGPFHNSNFDGDSHVVVTSHTYHNNGQGPPVIRNYEYDSRVGAPVSYSSK